MHPDLFPYQRDGAAFLAARGAALLADEMGVGKTPQAIAACDLTGARGVLVLCPAIARINWAREFQRWQTTSRSVAVLASGADKADADVLITSYALAAAAKGRLGLLKRRFDVLICDEAHALKSPRAQRTKAVYGGRVDRRTGLAANAARVWLLTGTPMPNNPSEIWTHLRALGLTGQRYYEFVEAFCSTYDDGFAIKINGAKQSAIPALLDLLRPFTLRRRLEEVQPELPPIRFGHVVVKPDKLPLRPDPTVAELTVIAALQAKLAQQDNADVTVHDTMHLAVLRRWTGIAKAQAVADLIKQEMEDGLGKAVVFAVHREVLHTIAAAFGPDAVLVDGSTPPAKRQAAIDDFQSTEGGPRVFVCQLAVGSTALTLTAANNVIFAETSWTPADVAQAAKRCHRIGQTRPVLARVVSLAASIDEEVNRIVLRKAQDLTRIELALAAQPEVEIPTYSQT